MHDKVTDAAEDCPPHGAEAPGARHDERGLLLLGLSHQSLSWTVGEHGHVTPLHLQSKVIAARGYDD